MFTNAVPVTLTVPLVDVEVYKFLTPVSCISSTDMAIQPGETTEPITEFVVVTAPLDDSDIWNLVCLLVIVLKLLLDVGICGELNPTGAELLVTVLVEIAAALYYPWSLPLGL